MYNSPTLLILTAFAGLAGALFTQLITVVNGYFIDKRKQKAELKNQHRVKKVEIGENFYYITGEKMASIRKNIQYWKNWNDSRTDASLEFVYKETYKFNNYMDKLNADNWKYNLIGLYFDVAFTNDEIVKSNARSHQLYISYLDLAEKIRRTEGDEKEHFYERYALVVFDMCSHYETIYARLEADMNTIKSQLLIEFTA